MVNLSTIIYTPSLTGLLLQTERSVSGYLTHGAL
ncbi:hypothetical protein DSUL_140071 [Desulfovibrionales bacterium]